MLNKNERREVAKEINQILVNKVALHKVSVVSNKVLGNGTMRVYQKIGNSKNK